MKNKFLFTIILVATCGPLHAMFQALRNIPMQAMHKTHAAEARFCVISKAGYSDEKNNESSVDEVKSRLLLRLAQFNAKERDCVILDLIVKSGINTIGRDLITQAEQYELESKKRIIEFEFRFVRRIYDIERLIRECEERKK